MPFLRANDSPLNLQFHHVTVVKDVVSLHQLAIKYAVAPDSSGLQVV